MKNDTNYIAKDDTTLNPTTAVVFDKSVLTELASDIGSSSLITDLSKIFFKNLPKTLTTIDTAWQANDNAALLQCFHSLKGNAATLGMDDLREMCTGLELTYRTAETPTFSQEELTSLKTASHQASQALKEFLKTL